MDSDVERSLNATGFAEVLVVLSDDAMAAGASGLKDSVERHLLKEAPVPAAAPVAVAARAFAQPLPTVFLPTLGVAIGYVDRAALEGVVDHEAVAHVHAAADIGLIHPVAEEAAGEVVEMPWGLRALGVEEVWDSGITGAGVGVAQLDTGVDGSHPALAGPLKSFAEWDFDAVAVPGAPARDSGTHGTHTAGTICGEKMGGIAIGVAPGADLHAGLVIEGGQVLMRVLRGMEHALNIPTDNPIRVLSMSLGFRGFTPFLMQVVDRIRAREVLPIIAIGNEGRNTSRSPGNYPQSLAVGAVDRDQSVARFSSSIIFDRPDDPSQPDVVAPGVRTLSALPGGGLGVKSGTSMATPHVAGVAALLFACKPTATIVEVEDAIRTTADPLAPEQAVRWGDGSVNLHKALNKLCGTNI